MSEDEIARLRSEVERITTQQDELLATLSHELRTPLNAILGWAELLVQRAPEQSELRRGLETIARNARAQGQLIDDLLDMSRIVAGKVRLDVQRVDLAAVINGAIDIMRASIEGKELVLRTDIQAISDVSGDPQRLQQIAWNLLSNAVKFTPKGGTITVVLRETGPRAELVVSDTGMGISPSFVPHVFDQFRQQSSTRRYGGLGLGLAVVKQLVELHGGAIRVESGGEGQGSSFAVSLPRSVQREDTPPPSEAVAVTLVGRTVMVIDDEADARAMLELVLGDAGATVIACATPEEAMRSLHQQIPDLIVSDIGMPDRDGYQLMRSIRNLPPEKGGRVPAVALTAFARSEDRTRALLAGYQVHMTKPVEPRELVATLASLTLTGGRSAP